MFNNEVTKGIVLKVSPVALAIALTLGSGAATAGEMGYLTSKTTDYVKSSAGWCWKTKGADFKPIEACGDKVMAEVKDSDGDGVPDDADKCPGTVAGARVDADGCELDSDGDGVVDRLDQCPGTPAGDKVDAVGCTIIGDVTINLVNDEFDFDSAALKPAMKTALDGVAAKISASAGDESLDIIGHTDSSGPDAYNQGLSERRAQSVADYLAGKGISASKMSVSGMGETSPVADNSTRAGRAQNRRVEIKTK